MPLNKKAKLPKSRAELLKEMFGKDAAATSALTASRVRSNKLFAAEAERGRKELQGFMDRTKTILDRNRAIQDQMTRSRQMTEAATKAAQDLARRSRGGR